MRWLLPSLFVAFLTACSGGEASDGPSDKFTLPDTSGQALTSACSGCHAPGGSAISDLSDWSAASIEQSLLTYKSDAQGTSVMHRLARGYSDEDIRRISAVLAQGNDEEP